MSKKFSVLIKNKINRYNKKITVDPDKSVSHRCYILASQCIGKSEIKGLNSEDVKATKNGLKKLGIKIVSKNGIDNVYGMGISGFKKFNGVINFHNSGTSARSFLGMLTCYPHAVTITGDSSLQKRPFKRLTNYLERIGATFKYPNNEKLNLPIKIKGTRKWALAQNHYINIPSAQITSALIYAALQTKGITEIIETHETRDHTQRLLKSLKADIQVKKLGNKRVTKIKGQVEMNNFSIKVAADPSSACFFIIQTLLAKKSTLLIKNVYINQNRIGFINILKMMGAKIKIRDRKEYFGEKIGDIFVSSSNLKGINCPLKLIVKSIDELPAIWVACALAKGKSYFKGISELRLKESDRIKIISENLKLFGIKTFATKDTLKIYGNPKIKIYKKIKIPKTLDHRICMSMAVLANVTESNVLIRGFETVKSSFPNFLKIQKKIGANYEIKKN